MKYLKIIAGIIATILLGALGSGIWERLLAPFLSFISLQIIQFVNKIYSGYIDSIYKSAAFDLPNSYQVKIAALLMILFGAYWSIIILSNFDFLKSYKSEHTSTHAENFSKQLYNYFQLIFLLASLTLFGMGLFMLPRTDYIQQTISYSFRSMEILRPYIGDELYLNLKSEYYRIESSKEFDSFNTQIVDLANRNNIKLPKFKKL